MAEFDHNGSGIVSECRNCYWIGSQVDGTKDVVGSIVALLGVRSDFVLTGCVRERAFSLACVILFDITKTDSACRQRAELSRSTSCSELLERIRSEALICAGPGRRLNADVQRGKAKWKFGSKCT
jgi:hypothetical protein